MLNRSQRRRQRPVGRRGRRACIHDAVDDPPALLPAALDGTVEALCELQRQRTIAFSVDVGRLIVEGICGGDLTRLRERQGKDCPSLRALAQHPRMPFSATALHQAIGVYQLAMRLPGVLDTELMLTHLRLVLPWVIRTLNHIDRLAHREHSPRVDSSAWMSAQRRMPQRRGIERQHAAAGQNRAVQFAGWRQDPGGELHRFERGHAWAACRLVCRSLTSAVRASNRASICPLCGAGLAERSNRPWLLRGLARVWLIPHRAHERASEAHS